MAHEDFLSLGENIKLVCFAEDGKGFFSKIRVKRINHRTNELQDIPPIPLLKTPASKKDHADINLSVFAFCEAASQLIQDFVETLSKDKRDIAFSLLSNEDVKKEMLRLGLSSEAATTALRTDALPKIERYLDSDEGHYETDQNRKGYGYKAREDDLLIRLRCLLDDLIQGKNLYEDFTPRRTPPISERDRNMVLASLLHITLPWKHDDIRTLFERIRKRISRVRHSRTAL